MRRLVTALIMILVLCGVFRTPPAYGQQKLAQTGMKFLNVTVDARAAALGEAYTAVDGYATSMFFNPAGMARVPNVVNVALGRVMWIADINHNMAAVSFRPWNGDYGVVGLMVQTVDYGELQGTVRTSTDQGYLDVGTFNPKATMIGVAYARSLSEKFAIGGAAKWVHQNLGAGIYAIADDGSYLDRTDITNVFAFDFGMMYKTGYKSLQFGVAVRNFSQEARYIDEGFQLPLMFRIGVSMNLADLWDNSTEPRMHELYFSTDAEHSRDYPERMKWGAEYLFDHVLALRAGFISLADEQKFSYGVGLQKALGGYEFGFDYAYTPFGIFDNVHTFTFKFAF